MTVFGGTFTAAGTEEGSSSSRPITTASFSSSSSSWFSGPGLTPFLSGIAIGSGRFLKSVELNCLFGWFVVVAS